MAVLLPALSDCDPGPLPSIDGVLDGSGDVDWYKYVGTDNVGCSVDPVRDFAALGGARLCKFADCVAGVAAVSCGDGATSATSPGGHPGCCHSLSFSMGVDCAGIDDDATIYIRVDDGNSACLSYSVDYHY